MINALRGTAVLLASGLALTVPHASAWAAPTLAQAKTIAVTSTVVILDKDGKPMPIYKMTTSVQRPNLLRVNAEFLKADPGKTVPASFYLQDGKHAYMFDGSRNVYTEEDAPKAGEQPSSQICNLAGADVVLAGGATPEHKGWKRTSEKVSLDGHDENLTTDTSEPAKLKDGTMLVRIEKTWVDASTGLPYRKAFVMKRGDKEQLSYQIDFSDWKLDSALPETAFAWAAPEGAKKYEEPKLLAAGTVAPDFTAVKPDGTKVKLSDLKGKIVVVDFWATWCGPCQSSMPHLEKVYKKVKDKGVAVLAVCVWDDKAAYDKWVVAKKGVFSFPTVFDPAARGDNSIAGKLYNVSGIPTQYIIGKDGKVIASNVGYSDGSTELEKALEKAGVKVVVE